jgi:hypothetical protein
MTIRERVTAWFGTRGADGSQGVASGVAGVAFLAGAAAITVIIVGFRWNCVNGVLWALAAVAVGGLFGFIFAVPRPRGPTMERTSEGKNVPVGDDAPSPIEQISDWLTKIIVGVSLVQYAAIRDDFLRTVHVVARGLGGPAPRAEAAAQAILLYFGILGFYTFYLITRLQLNRALGKADREVTEARRARRQVERDALAVGVGPAGSAAIAEKVGRKKFEPGTLNEVLTGLAADYERKRASMASGPDRTRELDNLVAQMRVLAVAGGESREVLMASSSPGERLVAIAFLQVRPDVAALPWLTERFAIERPFVQYHVALALKCSAEQLPAIELDRVAQAIDDARKTLARVGAKVDSGREGGLAAAENVVRARRSKEGTPTDSQ